MRARRDGVQVPQRVDSGVVHTQQYARAVARGQDEVERARVGLSYGCPGVARQVQLYTLPPQAQAPRVVEAGFPAPMARACARARRKFSGAWLSGYLTCTAYMCA
jgi:hypothetical protein